ncbi:MAG: archease [Nanoarchaeota archaeon]|nr:archease [Nanoarchaeota archaeon]MBU1622871.1 archease [Nanoarchaeota archaeon]MBU1974326.1 archease [Nanoarchaeota archaeon]
MKSYEFLPHTADTKIRAYGKTLAEAFINAALATTDTITDHKKIKPTTKKTINVESENKEALLYDFLEQFLILLDSESFLLSEVKELKITNNKLTATIVGDTHPENYEIKTHVKAITYQEMIIEEKKDQIMIQFILDI